MKDSTTWGGSKTESLPTWNNPNKNWMIPIKDVAWKCVYYRIFKNDKNAECNLLTEPAFRRINVIFRIKVEPPIFTTRLSQGFNLSFADIYFLLFCWQNKIPMTHFRVLWKTPDHVIKTIDQSIVRTHFSDNSGNIINILLVQITKLYLECIN